MPLLTTSPPPPLAHGLDAAGLFALDPDVLHLNHGSFGAVPRAALAEQARLKDLMERSPVLWFGELPERLLQARTAVADFLGVPAARTALVPNASAGITVVLNSLVLPEGAEVVVTDHGYGAVTMAAERAVARVGGRVVRAAVPLEAGAEETTALVLAAFTERTAVVVLDAITSPTARRMPVEAVSAAAAERGVVSVVDAAHAPGVLASPVEDCDYWVGNLHKYACAPRGTAALVVREGLGQELFPLIDSWGAREPFPLRFDYQGTLDATAWLAAPVALQTIEDVLGWDAVRRWSADLLDWASALVADRVAELSGWERRAAVGMAVPTMRLVQLPPSLTSDRQSSDALRDVMAREHRTELAITSFAGRPYLRLSAHAYTTPEDVLRFVDAPLAALLGTSG